jgi:hypothetical protein
MSSFLFSLGATTTPSRRSAWVVGACVTGTPTSAPRLRLTPTSFSASVSATLQVSPSFYPPCSPVCRIRNLLATRVGKIVVAQIWNTFSIYLDQLLANFLS